MNIVVITDDFYPNKGGISHTIINLYNYFQNLEHKLYILNPFYANKFIFKKINLKEYHLKYLSKFLLKRKFYFLFFSCCWYIIKDSRTSLTHKLFILLYFIFKPKIIMRIVVNIKNPYSLLKKLKFKAFLSAHSGWLLPLTFIQSRIFNKKLITLAHGNDFLVKNPLSLKPYFFKNADKIIVSNHIMLKYISKIHHIDERKIEIIRRGVDLNPLEIKKNKKELRKEFEIPENHFILLSVGRHVARKNFSDVIRAVKRIIEKKPQVKIKYYLIGEGEETVSLKNLVKTLKIESNVEFLGVCDDLTRNKYFKLADVFIMPVKPLNYDLEGFGIVFLEANFFNTPVIGTSLGGIPEAIIDKKTGLLVKPNDLEDLVEKIVFLYDHEEIREEMGKNGYERVANYFTWENVGNEYIKLFESL